MIETAKTTGSTQDLRQAIRRERRQNLSPPPRLTVSEWADRSRYLSPEASAEPGRWNTARVEPARGVMDAFSDPRVHTVTVMVCTQLLKTECLNNVVGYHVAQDPAPILVLQPSQSPMAESWSKDRLRPMVRDSPALRERIRESHSKDSENTILHKKFAGGHITVAGANSPASLSSRPIRIVLADEVDRYPHSVGQEGDPVSLAAERQSTFWNRKLGLFSTPTIKGASRIEASFTLSDQRRYFVPCPHCGAGQHLEWAQVQWPEGAPHRAAYCCRACGALWSEAERLEAIQRGQWRQTAPFTCCATGQTPHRWDEQGYAICSECGRPAPFRGQAGFHLNKIASPWTTLAALAERFIAVKDDPEQLQVFVNTVLAETWELDAADIEPEGLMGRREAYTRIPAAVAVLTAGVDTQDDRLEVEVKGWGKGYESWGIDYRIFYGNPGETQVWSNLEAYLEQDWPREDGSTLRVRVVGVDTMGHYTQEAYKFCKGRWPKGYCAMRGLAGMDRPVVGRPSTSNAQKVRLFPVGVDEAKAKIHRWLQVTAPGPGYCHFPTHYDDEWFRQVTAERLVTRYRQGQPRLVWEQIRKRNEALDCWVYALAALELSGVDLNRPRPSAPAPKRKRRRVISSGVKP